MSNMSSKPSAPTPAAGPPVGAAVQLKGGAAILAPVSAFPNGVPGNALVLLPINPNGTPLEKKIVDGPVALQMDEVWKLLGFNGPAVQVQDEQGRPIAIGLEDLLGGLEKHWTDAPDDLNRGRIFAQELMKYGRAREGGEGARRRSSPCGGDGEDWLGLGVAQLAQKKLDKAEATLRGAQNLLKDSPFPSLQLAKVMKEKGDRKGERENTERAIQIDNNSVDAWAYLANAIKEATSEDEMVKQVEELANAPVNAKCGAPYIALQGFYAADAKNEAARDRAIGFAKKAVERASGRRPRAALPFGALRAGRQDRRGRQAPRPPRSADAARRARRAQLLRGALPAPRPAEDHRAAQQARDQPGARGQAVRDRALARRLADAPAAAATARRRHPGKGLGRDSPTLRRPLPNRRAGSTSIASRCRSDRQGAKDARGERAIRDVQPTA